MPTSTFYHLPQAKREKLTRAIYQEAARVPFEDLSINRIVQAAGIPRGSYYQYFADKDDLFEFLIQDYHAFLFTQGLHCLQAAKGDVFSAFERLLELATEAPLVEGQLVLWRNLLGHRRIQGSSLSKCPLANLHSPVWAACLAQMDRSLLRLESEEDFYDLVEVLGTEFRWALVSIFCDLSRRKQVQDSFHRKLKLIGKGMLIPKEDTK